MIFICPAPSLENGADFRTLIKNPSGVVIELVGNFFVCKAFHQEPEDIFFPQRKSVLYFFSRVFFARISANSPIKESGDQLPLDPQLVIVDNMNGLDEARGAGIFGEVSPWRLLLGPSQQWLHP